MTTSEIGAVTSRDTNDSDRGFPKMSDFYNKLLSLSQYLKQNQSVFSINDQYNIYILILN